MDPASIHAITELVSKVWEIAAPFLVGWHIPQPSWMKSDNVSSK